MSEQYRGCDLIFRIHPYKINTIYDNDADLKTTIEIPIDMTLTEDASLDILHEALREFEPWFERWKKHYNARYQVRRNPLKEATDDGFSVS